MDSKAPIGLKPRTRNASKPRRRRVDRDAPRWSDEQIELEPLPEPKGRGKDTLLFLAFSALVGLIIYTGGKIGPENYELQSALDTFERSEWSRPHFEVPDGFINGLDSARFKVTPELLEQYPDVEKVIVGMEEIVQRAGKRKAYAQYLSRLIVAESSRAKYDPLFVTAVIRTESSFNPLAVSHVGATGLMQIMPDTGRYLMGTKSRDAKVLKLTDMSHNLRLGIRYLKQLERRYNGNQILALMAYNWGPARVDQAILGRRHVPASVVKYARKIITDHRKWSQQYLGRKV